MWRCPFGGTGGTPSKLSAFAYGSDTGWERLGGTCARPLAAGRAYALFEDEEESLDGPPELSDEQF
jgi:hypothetical protein